MRLTELSHAAGCGCKLGPDELRAVLSGLVSHSALDSPALVVGVGGSDDAGVVRLPSGELVVQTTDFFTPIVDDPYDWGRIAATNALSDVYAIRAASLRRSEVDEFSTWSAVRPATRVKLLRVFQTLALLLPSQVVSEPPLAHFNPSALNESSQRAICSIGYICIYAFRKPFKKCQICWSVS